MLFSQRLHRCFTGAGDRARTLGHRAVGCEHVMLSMLGDKHGWPAAFLEERGVLQLARTGLEELLEAPEWRWGSSTPMSHLEPTPRLMRCIERAGSIGSDLGHDAITSEHLLVAFAEDENGACATLLEGLESRRPVIEAGMTLMRSEDYFTGRCVVVDRNDVFLGLPILKDGELWLKRPGGRTVRPEDA
ncbi:MAG: Clp protease N-terminal domain-containing protein [Actinomycetota bacterium]